MDYLVELKKTIERYDIDKVTLKNMVESCLESEDITYKKAQTAYLFSEEGSYSEKPSNIRTTFNLGYAIQIISAAAKIAKGEKLGLICGILEVIRALKDASKVKFTELEAEVLYLITTNTAKTADEIRKEINKGKNSDDKIDENAIQMALQNLKSLDTIKFEEGVYRNQERVVICS